MTPTRSMLALLAAAAAAACGGGAEPSQAAGPQPREGDPALDHTWTMPAQSSALASGDLGSTPPELAATLMEGGRMPSIAHRIAKGCADAKALAGTDEIALRFAVAEGGKVGDVQPDPADRAGTCLAEALGPQLSATEGELPAGAALLRIRLHPSG